MMSMFWNTASAVPRYQAVSSDALAGGQDVEGLVALGAQEVPAALQVADQAVRLVLRGHRDAADAGIDRVRQREVDDARLAAEDRPPAWRAGRSVPCRRDPRPPASTIGHGAAGIGRADRSVRSSRHGPSPFACAASCLVRRVPGNRLPDRARRSGGRPTQAEAGRPWQGSSVATHLAEHCPCPLPPIARRVGVQQPRARRPARGRPMRRRAAAPA